MANGGPEIEQLIQLLARLPGLGPRSARRAVLHLIKKKEQLMLPLSAALVTPDGSWEDGYLSYAFEKVMPGAGFIHGSHPHRPAGGR